MKCSYIQDGVNAGYNVRASRFCLGLALSAAVPADWPRLRQQHMAPPNGLCRRSR